MYVPTGHSLSLSMPMFNWVLITYTPLEEKFKYNIPLAYLLVSSPAGEPTKIVANVITFEM